MSHPYTEARAIYDREPCARTFQQDLDFHFRFGFVFSAPRFFIMGRPVIKGAPPAAIVNPAVQFNGEECDCWHVYLMAGDLAKIWEIVPWPLPWCSWERKNELRFTRFAAIRRLARP
jgi:hypothetical protein